MQTNYAATTAFTRKEEGGYTADGRDSGNWSSGIVGKGTLIGSNMGCGAPATLAYLARTQPSTVLTAALMQTLPTTIYDGMAQTGYWAPLQCGTILGGLDLMLFDFGWNTGIGSSAKRLQWLVGADQDGDIGQQTLQAVNACSLAPIAKALSEADARTLQGALGVGIDGDVGTETLDAIAEQPAIRPIVLLLGLGEAQASYYRSLYNFSTYGAGWLARTGRRVSAGLTLAGAQSAAEAPYRARSLPAPRVPDEALNIRWLPFEPGRPIADQAARLAA